jgi:hypothetical protein
VRGTAGCTELPSRLHHPGHIGLHRVGSEPEVIETPAIGAGRTGELIEATERVAGGHPESEIVRWPPVAVQEVPAEIAAQLGLRVIEVSAGLARARSPSRSGRVNRARAVRTAG